MESNTPSVVAAQTLDTMSIHLPPEKFMPVILSHVQPALTSQDTVKLRGKFWFGKILCELFFNWDWFFPPGAVRFTDHPCICQRNGYHVSYLSIWTDSKSIVWDSACSIH